jgi:hypothetical protein
MINPSLTTVHQLLTLDNHFVIPKFQRDYTWTKDEASEFFEDILGESSKGLFLGTIILDNSVGSDKRLSVVDGQQRLTSLFLLLIACRRHAKAINEPKIEQIIQERITFVEPTTAKSLGPRLIASSSIRDVYEQMASSEWDGPIPTRSAEKKSVKRQSNRVRPIYELFSDRLKGKDRDGLSKILEAIYKVRMFRVEIDSEQEAFSIFERTNARGVDLEISDLLKNFLYQQNVPELDETWDGIISYSDGTILKMLKYFYVSKQGYTTKSELYRKLKEYCQRIGGANVLLQELLGFSEFYATIRRESPSTVIQDYFRQIECPEISEDADKFDRVHQSFQSLRLFNVSQIYPVIAAAISSYVRDGKKNTKALIRLLETFEKYHFVNNAICDRVGNEVEKLYANLCIDYDKTTPGSGGFATVSDNVVAELKSRLASRDEFTARFCEVSYSADSIALICYIFDRFTNYDHLRKAPVPPASRIKIYDPMTKVRRNHNVEHFAAQKPEDGTKPIDEVDNIGNLFALSFRTNSRLQSIAPKDKVKKLKGELWQEVDNQHYVKRFLDKYENAAEKWSDIGVKERAKDLAQEAYDVVWSL